MSRIFVLFILSALGALLTAEAQPGYVSPLTGALNAHDPVMLRQDGVYYVFHTGNGVQIKTSRDRRNWEVGAPDRVVQEAPAWHAKYSTSTSLWAPAAAKWGGKYWLYYSLSNFGERRSAIGLSTNTTLNPADPAYAWVDQGMVVCTYNNAATHPECFHASTSGVNTTDTAAFNAIDPDVHVDDAGTPWLVWGSFGAGIQLIALDPATGKPAPGAKPVTLAHRYFTGAPGGSANYRSIEAPVLHKRGSWYYLWYSHDQCCAQAQSTYKVVVTRSASLTGPYVDRAGNPAHPPYRGPGGGGWQNANAGTLVSQGDSINWAATGHNDVFFANDSSFLVNHGYAWPGGQTRLMIRTLYWDAEGWPTLDSTRGTTSLAPRRTALPRSVEAKLRGLWVPWRTEGRDLRGRVER